MWVKSECRQFIQGFKKNAVQLVTEKRILVGMVTRDLDIHPDLVHQWRRLFLAEGERAFVGNSD